ncbi:MAG: ATP-binding protein [Acidobacteriota bacterium]|nr:ATP-binding protein [Acidobacteriota bacterium]
MECLPRAEAVRLARSFVLATLREWRLESLGDSAAVCTSELVTNAVVHARSPFRLAVERHSGELVITVEDTSTTGVPAARRPSSFSEGGRGLLLVDALSSRWGYRVGGRGKVVWCSFATRGGAAPAGRDPSGPAPAGPESAGRESAGPESAGRNSAGPD